MRFHAPWLLLLKVLRLLLAILFFIPAPTIAAPPSPEPFVVRQPSGMSFRAVLLGSEFFSWQETEDGFLILQDAEDGFWKYAVFPVDSLEPRIVENAIVGVANPETLAPQGLQRGARPNKELLARHIRQQEPTPTELPRPESSPAEEAK